MRTVTTLDGIEHRTAATMVRLALLRGVACSIEWLDEEQSYAVNGQSLNSKSIESVRQWLDRQPGVKE